MKTTLVCVVTGETYEHFADDLFSSAEEFFHPTNEVEYLMLPGRPGWPDATMYRHHVLVDAFPDSDYVFLSDADMLFVDDVWGEVLSDTVSATLHPGYCGQPRETFPYETRDMSWACVPPDRGLAYYCGGFIGGTSASMLGFSRNIAMIIDHDVDKSIVPLWHDESALNSILSHSQPGKTLSPSYCYPRDDSYYRGIWPETYEPKLVALDKTEEQREQRG